MEYEGTPESVYHFLLSQDKPRNPEEIKEELNTREDYVEQALMELFDRDKVDWPSPREWVALADEQKTIETEYARINIGIVHD